MKLPIAITKTTNQLVNAKDVLNGLECDCVCPGCGEDLVAVNQEKKQRAHFRHSSNTSCSIGGNYESYIHWLAKTIFQNVDSFNLPPIYLSDLERSLPANHNLRYHISKQLEDSGATTLLIFQGEQPYNIMLQKPTMIEISSCEIEKEFNCVHGKIRADIVLVVNGKSILIEPFFTHGIDYEKRKKIGELNLSTISINLLEFVKQTNYIFSIEEFVEFLMYSVNHKKWVYINKDKSSKLITALRSKITEQMSNYKVEIVHNQNIEKEIKEKEIKRSELLKEIMMLEKDIDFLNRTKKRINVSDFYAKI